MKKLRNLFICLCASLMLTGCYYYDFGSTDFWGTVVSKEIRFGTIYILWVRPDKSSTDFCMNVSEYKYRTTQIGDRVHFNRYH